MDVPHYVYGIVEANATVPKGRGIANASLGLVVDGDVAALVSKVGGDEVRLGREQMLVHSRVLENAMDTGTVLPMRFGVVMSGPDDIRRRLLEEHAETLRAQLDALDGKVEIRIRAVYDERLLLREVVNDDPELASLAHSLRDQPEDASYYGRIRLGELVAAAIENRRAHDADTILEALSRGALAVDEGQPGHERVVVNASFLVERARMDAFARIVDEVAEAYGGRMRLKFTGPLPPHSFVDLVGQ